MSEVLVKIKTHDMLLVGVRVSMKGVVMHRRNIILPVLLLLAAHAAININRRYTIIKLIKSHSVLLMRVCSKGVHSTSIVYY